MAHRPDPSPTELEALNVHIAGLLATDKRLSEEELDLDKLGAVPVEPKAGDSVASKTRHFMNGFNFLPSLGLSKGERLFVVRQDREGIRLALSELEQQRQRLLGIQAQADAQAALPAWRALVRDVCLTAAKLKALEAKVIAMRQGPGGQLLPVYQFSHRSILNVPWPSDPAGEATRAAIAAGYITKREIEEASK